MMRLTSPRLLVFLLPILSFGNASEAGLIGYGISRWQPRCPYTCQSTLITSDLACTKHEEQTTPDCYASDHAFLGSLAWCIYSRCSDLSLWQVEEWWTTTASGDPAVPPDYSFVEALPKSEPSVTVTRKKPLDVVSKTQNRDYQIAWNTFSESDHVETAGSTYAIILICVGLLVPAAFSLLRFLPTPKTLTAQVSAYLILPATWGAKHRRPIRNVGICPTRGQALFVFLLLALNLVFSFATYPSRLVPIQQQTRFKTRRQQLLVVMANRLAVMCLSNLALMVLYAGRNNFLLWITQWQRETFLLFHHWLGYMIIAGASLHAAIYLYLAVNSGRYTVDFTEMFWKFGIVAVISFALIVPFSLLPIRVRVYEVFLNVHRLLASLVLVGIFVHVYVKNADTGLHNWIYAVLAALGFDYLMRVLRIAKNGVRRAKITVIDEDYLRIDISGLAAEGHAYVYFPTLTWRIWENHPFSVAASFHNGTVSTDGSIQNSGTASLLEYSEKTEAGNSTNPPLSDSKEILTIATSSPMTSTPPSSLVKKDSIPTAGITFFIRQRAGLTSLLVSRTKMPVLIESSYGSLSSLRTHPNLIAIAGGVGIVTVLPVLRIHAGRSKLYWGLRTQGLLGALTDDLLAVDKEVFVGQRMDVRAILEKEIGGDQGKGAVVVVSGPAGLADDVRAVVCELGKKKGAWPVKLVDESFG